MDQPILLQTEEFQARAQDDQPNNPNQHWPEFGSNSSHSTRARDIVDSWCKLNSYSQHDSVQTGSSPMLISDFKWTPTIHE